jgi:predicted ATPase
LRDVAGFREAVRLRRRSAGRTQQQLARAMGVHPDVLSHKLNQRSGAMLTTSEVVAIVTTLAGWGAIGSQAEARALLAMMAVPPNAVPEQAWVTPPLASLPATAPSPALVLQNPAVGYETATPVAGPERIAPVPPPAAERDGGRLAPVPVPVPLTPLVGREAEVAAAVAAVTASRLVTLTGIGGTGKTRVATRAAAVLAGEFADGVAFADLAPVDDLDLVAVTLLRALGLTPQAAGAAEEQLVAALRGARLLLVADNMEHLVERAPLLGRVLAAAPGLHLLVTSRVTLGLYGEYQLRVPPLHLPGPGDAAESVAASEAVQLFVQRARAVVPGFEPQGEALSATAAICAALDGLPLAIELAASWVKLYPPQALLSRLEERLSLLTGGPRNLPQRQQTLRATLDWSDALLPGATQELFARIGVFAGPFDATAAAAVSGAGAGPAAVLGQLAELAGHSMLEVTAGEVPRFGLLATVREYALARLAETGQADQVHDRYLRYWLARANQARASLDGPQQAGWLDRLEAEFADIRAALDWARVPGPADGSRLADGLRLATAVAPVWRRRGSLAEGALHLERLLAIDAERHAATPAVRAWALLEACAMACFRGDYPATATFGGEGLALCEDLADLPGRAWAHRYLGEAALATGDLTTAQPHFERQLDLAQQAEDRWTEAQARNMLGQLYRYQGQHAEAEAQVRQALACFQAVGDPDGTASALNSLGEVARDSGQPGQARALFQRALRGHQQTGSKRGMAADLEGLAGAAALSGEDRSALVYLGAAQALREASGGPMLPAEHAILTRLLGAGAAPLTGPDRDGVLAEGRNRPLAQVIAEALGS